MSNLRTLCFCLSHRSFSRNEPRISRITLIHLRDLRNPRLQSVRIFQMLTSFLIAGLLFAGQESSAMISGSIVPPPQQQILKPVQVILLPPRYADLWNTEVQKRLDVYWQQY